MQKGEKPWPGWLVLSYPDIPIMSLNVEIVAKRRSSAMIIIATTLNYYQPIPKNKAQMYGHTVLCQTMYT